MSMNCSGDNVCAVVTCINNYKKIKENLSSVSFYRFPKDEALKQMWTAVCGISDVLNINDSSVCSDHFAPEDFESDLKSELVENKRIACLKQTAVPSLNVPVEFLKKLINSSKESVEALQSKPSYDHEEEMEINKEPAEGDYSDEEFIDPNQLVNVILEEDNTDSRDASVCLVKLEEKSNEKNNSAISFPIYCKESPDKPKTFDKSKLPKDQTPLKLPVPNKDNWNAGPSGSKAVTGSSNKRVLNRIFKCPDCKYSTNRKGVLNRHVTSVHIGNKPYHCTECDYKTSQKHNLKAHVEAVHTKEKAYKCPQCDYQSSWRNSVKIHIKSVHVVEKEHRCSECEYQTSRKCDLNYHVLSVHRKEKRLQCPHCDYQGSHRGNLNTHILTVHKGEKPFPCPYCDHQASQRIHLNNHIMSVHIGEKPFECPLCEYRASDKYSIKKHMKRKHSDVSFSTSGLYEQLNQYAMGGP